MTLNKRIAAFSLLVLVGGFLIYKVFFVSSSDSEDTRNTENNTASYKVVESQKIIVGKDIDPGYYDIKALDNEAEFFGDKMHDNAVLHAVPIHMNGNLSIKGRVEFKPSEFEKKEKKGQKYIIKDPGYYEVGTEIQEGNYVLSKTSHTIRVFVDIKDKTETESLQTIQWEIDEKVKKPIEIELKNGYNVYIDKTGKDGFISNEGDLILERNNEDSESFKGI
ncbi:hypothetical protein Q8G35_14300 [Peribacillus simplex]|uniref:Uncharacterized protein n=2 Tax=Peribacillus TaxID=2675229 RepID=A0AA90PDK3_9BACI|nr:MULTISPECIES: hypothetical protein [Peribacillus]MDP1419574.1 hypothetical protein [Peribacillus simplex]MDP1452541.1 hypothetical protein [Peribacillus frigoritolerans]